MALIKGVHNNVLDAALNHIRNNTGTIALCKGGSAAINTYAEANAATGTNLLAALRTVVQSSVNAAFSAVTSGDVSGRKLRIKAVSSASVTGSSSTNVVNLVDEANSLVLYQTTVSTPQAVVSGNTVNTTVWDIEIADPT
jgi:hypothetical protein